MAWSPEEKALIQNYLQPAGSAPALPDERAQERAVIQSYLAPATPVTPPAPAPIPINLGPGPVDFALDPGSAGAPPKLDPISQAYAEAKQGLPAAPAGRPAVGGMGRPARPAGPPAWLQRAMQIDPSIDEGRLLPRKVGPTVDPFTPTELAAVNEAEGEQFKATFEQGEASIKAAEDTANRAVEAADEQAMIDQGFADREMQRQQELQGMEAKFGDLSDEIASTPIETPSLWGDDTGSQILNRIALFVGTIGSGVSGSPNLVWEKLNRDVENNVARQKEKKLLKREQLKDQAMMIDSVRARFQDERVVDATLKEAAYRKIGAELQRFAEFAKTPERKAALDALMAQNNLALTEQERQRRAAMDADVLQRRALAARANARPDPLAALVKRTGQYRQVAENLRGIAGKDPKETMDVPLWGAQVPKEIGKEAVNASISYRQIYSEIAKYKNRSVGESGTDAQQKRMTILLKKNAGQGFSSDADMDLLSGQIPDPSNPNFGKRMQEFEEGVRNQEQAYRQGIGAAPSFSPTTERKP